VAKNNIVWKVRPDQKVVIKGEWDTPAQRLDAAEKILTQLVKLAKAA
jgi:transcription-repair coupling factor (superfamily II helicase)